MNEDLRKKINVSISSPFIGEIIFSDEEIDEMIDDCKRAYQLTKSRYWKNFNINETEELVVLIINIAKQWIDESEGRFWVKLFNQIFEDGTIQPSKFYDDFESCLIKHNHVLFRSKEKKRMFRETFLMHAFAPETSSDSFIKLIWRWYSDNEILNFDYRKTEDESIVQKFVQFLRITFSDELDFDEDISFEGTVYQIKSSFKYLFTQDPDNGYILLDALFENFNSVYRSMPGNTESFFWKRASVVINKMLEEARILKGGRHTRTITNHIIDDYSKIHIDYGFSSSNELILTIPEIRAIDEAADEYYFDIFNSNEHVARIQGYILGEGFRRKIKSREIELSDYRSFFTDKFDLRVEMLLNRKGSLFKVYDSKQSLIRNYVLFKSSREIRAEVCNPGIYYVAFPSNIDIGKYTNCSTGYVNDQVISLVGEEGTYLSLNDRRTFFSTKQKGFSQFISDGAEINNLYLLHNGLELSVFKRLDGISILSSEIIDNPTSVVISINNEIKLPLSEIAEKKDAILYVDLRKCENIYYGYNKISFVDMSKQKVLRIFEFCVNDKIEITVSKFAFDNKSTRVRIQGQEDDIDVFVSPDRDSYQFEFYDQDYLLYLPNIGWRIDENEWNYSCIGEILWHEDDILHNNCVIEVENHSKEPIVILANEEELETSDNNVFKLGNALTKLESDDFVTITLVINTNNYEILKIANTEILEDFELDVESKEATILPYFVGKDNSRFTIDLEGELTYSIDLDENFKFEEDIEDDYYNVTISVRDIFDEKKPILEMEDVIIGNPDKIAFEGLYIELKQFRSLNGEKVKLSGAIIKDIEYLRNEGFIAVYSGNMRIAKKDVPIEIHVRDEKVLSFFKIEGESFMPLSYDLTKKSFTTNEPNGENIIPCGTCYYDTKEV